MLLNCGVGEDSWESLGLQGDPTSPSYRKSVLNIHWKDWCWSWNSNILAPWCEELTHLKRPKCWERLKAGGEGNDRGWDGWMASPTQWTWVWASSGVGDGQGNLTCCSPWGRKESDTTKQLNWTELNWTIIYIHWWPSKNPTVAWHRWEMVGESSEISMALLVSLRHCVPYSMIYLLFASSRWFIK